MKIPQQGMKREELFARMGTYRNNDMPWKEGRVFGYVYDAGEEIKRIGEEAYIMFLGENALDPTVFPSLLRFEKEVVDMARHHLGGDEEVTGNFTSGGTESCMMSVKTARDWARKHKPEITEPELLLPATAHAAFHKGCHYFGVKPVVVDVDFETYRADIDALKGGLSKNTIMMVGSAVSYAHGVCDPIPEMGQLALEKDILFHVDGCIGGFVLPYFKRFGAPVGDFDFRVPGVTSMSMDLHKYAYCPKQSSVLLYKNKDLREHQIFACSEWTGYTIINATMQSTKSGGPLAATWAVLNYLGDAGYEKIMRQMYDDTQTLLAGIKKIDGLEVMGEPDICLIGVTSKTINLFHIIDEMKTRGWYIQPQLRLGDKYPHNFHLSVSLGNSRWIEPMLKDLAECTEIAKGMPMSMVPDQMKELLASLKPEDLEGDTLDNMLGMAGAGGFELPERMAPINEMLNLLEPELSNRLLTIFLNELIHPDRE